jgi:hypothetical protein
MLLVAAIAASGIACSSTYGSRTVHPSSFDYGEALARSWNEQMLLALVKLRYRDTVQFLQVSSVLTQFEFNGSAGGSGLVGLNSRGTDILSADAGVSYAERPTITYVPIQGKDFSERLLSPISPATIVLLSQSGWSIERLTMCCVQTLNELQNAPSATGPTPDYIPRYEAFHEIGALLRELQLSGAISVSTRETDGKTMIMMVFRPKNDEQVRTVARLQEMLGIEPDQMELELTTPHLDRSANQIAIEGRSLMAVLFFASHSVEVPSEHQTTGLVTVTRDKDGRPFDWSLVTGKLLRVASQVEEPASAFVKVRYRGHWFYIADDDLNSKTTFGLIRFLFSLQSAPSGTSPLLTVSTGG